jgi:hypothetical protein
MKHQIDIEALLEWAYRRQCVDRVAGQRFTPKGPSGDANGAAVQMMMLGCRVDSSSYAARVLGAYAPDDAMILHDTVLALDDLYIDLAGGVWTSARVAEIGARLIKERGGFFWLEIDGSRTPLECAHLKALVITHAKVGGRPEWCAGWRDPGNAVASDRGAKDRCGRKRRAKDDYSPEDVAFYRAQYRCWHAALVLLAAELQGALAEYEVTGPAAPAEPWKKKPEKMIAAPSPAKTQTMSAR